MTVEELVQRLELRVAVGGEALSREVAGATAATCSVG